MTHGVPEGPLPPPVDTFGRGLHVGAQGVAKMPANILGLPGDIETMGRSAIDSLAGTNFAETPFFPPSEKIQQGFGDTLREFGMGDAIIPQSEMSPSERVAESINTFGSEALAGGTGLMRAAATKGGRDMAGFMLPRDVAESAAKGTAARTLVGDTAAGAGAGAAMQGFQESNLDEAAGDAFGPAGEVFANLLMALVGGTTGNLGAKGAMGVGNLGARGVKSVGSLIKNSLPGANPAPRPPMAVDSVTNKPFPRSVVDTAGFVAQRQSSAPKAARARLLDRVDDLRSNEAFADSGRMRPGEMPTSGALAQDQGLAALEKTFRTTNEVPFRERDAKQADFRRDVVESIAPEGDGRAFTDEFGRRAEARQGEAARKVSEAETAGSEFDAIRKETADFLAAEGAGGADAARNIDDIVTETTREATNAKNEKFKAAATDEPRDLSGIQKAVETERTGVSGAGRAADETPVGFMNRIRAQRDIDPETGKVIGPGELSVKDLQTRRMELKRIENDARTEGKFDLVDSARRIRKEIESDFEKLADEGNPEAQDALDFFAKEFGPTFARGKGDAASDFRTKLNRDPENRSATPPSKTAAKFIRAGDPEAAASFARVLEKSPRTKEGQASARTFILSNMLSRGVIGSDGAINRVKLGKFRKHFGDETIENAAPGLAGELDTIASRAGADEATSARLKAEIDAARADAKLTDKQISEGALGFALGKSPTRAIQDVFSSKDPERAMAAVVKEIGDDTAAHTGLKQSVREWLLDSKTLAESGIGSARDLSPAKLSDLMQKHAGTLGEVFDEADMNKLRQVHKILADEKMVKAAKAVSGSDTSPRDESVKRQERAVEAGVKWHFGVLAGGGVMRILRTARESLPGRTFKEKVNDLLMQMAFDPELAAHLLARDVDVKAPAWNKRLQTLIGVGESVRSASEDDE